MQSVRLVSNSVLILAVVMLSAIATECSSIAADGLEYLYVDNDVLCQGFSPEGYYHRIQQHAYQQRAMYAEYQHRLAYEAAAEQKAQERIQLARRTRLAKQARLREESIAKRKAEIAAKNLSKTASPKFTDTTLIADQ